MTEDRTIPWTRIVADAGDALVYADRQGIIQVWNAQAEALFGFDAAEALGQSLDLIIPARFRKAHWAAYEQAMKKGRMANPEAGPRTTRSLHKDGGRLYVDMSFSVVKDHAGRILGSVAVARHTPGRQ